MTRYYVPSKDEVKAIDQICKQMQKIATERFLLDDPFIDFPYEDGLHYQKMHEQKEFAMVLRSINSEDIHVRVMVQNGLLLYYKYKGEKTYVSKLKDVAKNANVTIRKGHWKQYKNNFVPIEVDEKVDNIEDNTFDGYTERPTFYNPVEKKKEQISPEDEWADKYQRYLLRKEYCQQYREMFGTESTEVNEEFYFFGDN